MITAEWVRLMARHNAWQNGWMIDAITGLPAAEAMADRGLFFGSIFATANHLLWGDMMWMHRLGAGEAPAAGAADHMRLTADAAEWATLRRRTDAGIMAWAGTLDGLIEGDVVWHSAFSPGEIRTPLAIAISHLFLHGVHHRGQIHAGLTQAGVTTPDTDLPKLPETI
ncbi:DinB family protein [Jannaschia marina]|uniref:DinB family protein n=1 Tax=Jannaschia marina TaxID=2741674 RepID=UPI0015C7996B|nr:DinB family protein [Jannaschia marina]